MSSYTDIRMHGPTAQESVCGRETERETEREGRSERASESEKKKRAGDVRGTCSISEKNRFC